MTLDIRPVRADDPAAIDAWCEITQAVRDHDLPQWRDNTRRTIRLLFTVPFWQRDLQ